MPDAKIERRPYPPGERFALIQPSRSSCARLMRPRRYRTVFTVTETGDVVHSGGVRPRPVYRAMAAMIARAGDADEFFEGVHDGRDPDSPDPGGNRHPDYVAGFRAGHSDPL